MIYFGFFLFQFVMTTGIKVIVYLTSIVFSIMFEIPYTNLSSRLLKQTLNRKIVISQQTNVAIDAKKAL